MGLHCLKAAHCVMPYSSEIRPMSKRKAGKPVTLSPARYVATRARELPLYKCLLNEDWKEKGMAFILVMRRHKTGNVTSGLFLVDLFALGVKDTYYRFNVSEAEATEMMDNMSMTFSEADYVLVHNIIYGALAFAEEHGFKPHRDFALTVNILEEDTEDIPLMDIEFGMDGQPVFIG